MLKSLIFALLIVFISTAYAQVYTTSDNTGGTAIGAVYVMSNEIANRILIYRLNSDGKLSYVRSVNTTGTGDNAASTSYYYYYNNIPLSRRTIQVYSNYLFAVNPGSDTLSMFTINTSDATVLNNVTSQSLTGHFPVSVAVNSMYACVLSIGYTGAIDCFTYNSSGLTKISSSNPNLTLYINSSSTSNIWNSRTGEILFSADNINLIVTTSDQFNYPYRSKIVFFGFNGSLALPSNLVLDTNATVPISVTLVGTNGLFITTQSGMELMTYQLSNGIVSSPVFLQPVYFPPYLSFVSCPTSSPTIGSYFAISPGSGLIQMNVNSTGAATDAFNIVPYYSALCNDYNPVDATILTANNIDYMFVLNEGGNFISSYQLQAGNSPTAHCYVTTQADSTTLGKVRGIAGFIQNVVTSSTAIELTISYMTLLLIFSIHLFS